MSLAQIGEFAFVLLSRASNLQIIEVCLSIYYSLKSVFVAHVILCLTLGGLIASVLVPKVKYRNIYYILKEMDK